MHCWCTGPFASGLKLKFESDGSEDVDGFAADPQRITAEDLHLTPPPEEVDAALPSGDKWPLQDYLDRVERAAINEALEKTRYNRTAAAKLLGITFRAMRYRMERLGIK